MKKLKIWWCVLFAIFFVGCAEKATEFTVSQTYNDLLGEYNLEEAAESLEENEDGSVTYFITDSKVQELKEKSTTNLSLKIDAFVELLRGIDADVVADIAYNEDGTMLEAKVTDAAAAQGGLLFLIGPSYPDVLALQILSGINPTGITVKTIDAETEEVFENTFPF